MTTSEVDVNNEEDSNSNTVRFEVDEWYYVNLKGQEIGPISHIQLKEDWGNCQFTGNQEVWCPGMSEWLQVNDFPDLMDFLKVDQQSQQTSEPLPPHSENSSNKETKLITFPSDSPMGISYSGNRIVEVAPNSKASKLGVCIGWHILFVNGKKQPNNHEVILAAITQCKKRGGNIEVVFNTVITEDANDNVGTLLVVVLCQIPTLLVNNSEVKVTNSLGPQVTVNGILQKTLQTLKARNLLIDSSGTDVNNFGLKLPDCTNYLPISDVLKDIATSSHPEFWMTQLNQVRITRMTLDGSMNPLPLESQSINHEYSNAIPDESTLNVLFEKFITNKGFKGRFAINIRRLSMSSKWHLLCQNIKDSVQPESIREGFLNKSPPEEKWKNKDVNQLKKCRFLLFTNRFSYQDTTIDTKVRVKKKVGSQFIGGISRGKIDEVGANKMSGNIPLDSTTQVYSDQSLGIQNAFVIITNVGKLTNQLFCLQASTPGERDSWVVTLSDIISCIPKDKTKHNELVEDMMLGIRNAIGKLGSIPASERLTLENMEYVSRTEFKACGSKNTPPHKNRDFYFKDYAPKVFRRIRARFGIDPVNYMLDVCGNSEYLEFLSNSKSGQFFFYTHNRKYMIKTISHNECKTLMSMLSVYYRHLMSNKNTLLTPFFGLHKVAVSGTTYWFLIMGSVFPTNLRMHFTFDLKGSTRHRQVKAHEKVKEGTVFKDKDFISQKIIINVGSEVAKKLKAQLESDVKFLAEYKIIDYSILLGVHYLTTDEKKNMKQYGSIYPPTPSKLKLKKFQSAPQNRLTLAPCSELKDLPSSVPKDNLKVSFQMNSLSIKTWKENGTRFSEELQNVLAMDDNALERLTQEEFNKLFTRPALAQGLYSELQAIQFSGQKSLISSKTTTTTMTMTVSKLDQRPPLPLLNRTITTPFTKPLEEISHNLSQSSCFKLHQGGLLGKKCDTIFFIGIIDTLIEYNIGKKCENRFKTKVKQLNEDTISVVAPDVYATRFLSFIKKYIE